MLRSPNKFLNYYCKKENLKSFDYSTWMQQADRQKSKISTKTGVRSILEVVAGFLTSILSAASIKYLDDHTFLGYIDSRGLCLILLMNY
jgi:hypothetical protein